MTIRYGSVGTVLGALFGGLTGAPLGVWLQLGAFSAVLGCVLGFLVGRAMQIERDNL